MVLSLAAIMLHESFDWSCRKNKSSLVKNRVTVVKGMRGVGGGHQPLIPPLQGSNEVLQLGEIEEKRKAWKGEVP